MSAAFLLILLSAFFHALWNALLKASDDKVAYVFYLRIATAFFITLYTALFHTDAFYIHKPTIIYALLSSFFFFLYQHFAAVSYKYADVSMVYPITTSSPLFIILWAYLFLDEKVSFLGVSGVVLIFAGCYIMNITRGKGNKKGLYGILLAFTAAFLYSFGAVADKLGVGTVNPDLYIMLMADFILMYSLIFTVMTHRKGRSLHKVLKTKLQWELLIAGGLAMAASTVTYRIGLIDMQVSYAAAIRELSSLFGVLMGIFFLKESYGPQRIVGSVVIITGIILINFGI